MTVPCWSSSLLMLWKVRCTALLLLPNSTASGSAGSVLAPRQILGWTIDEAGKVVEATECADSFHSVAELTVYAEVDPCRVDGVADLLVFCRL